MNTAIEYGSTISAAMDFFGKMGKTSLEFMQEWKQLTPADQAEIKEGLVKMGYKIK